MNYELQLQMSARGKGNSLLSMLFYVYDHQIPFDSYFLQGDDLFSKKRAPMKAE